MFPPPNTNLTEIPCSIVTDAFYAFLILYSIIYAAAICLSFLAAAFQRKRVPRIQLLTVSVHSSAGLALCLGSAVRDDFYATGNDGFWVCFALYISLVLAHSLLMTDTIKTLSLRTAPTHITYNAPLVKQLTDSSLLQKIVLGIAGIQIACGFVAFLLIIPANVSTSTFWNDDPQFYFRKEFLFCLGCLLASTTTATFIAIPVRHTHRMWRFCKDTRERTKVMIPQSPAKIVEVKKVVLGAVEEAEGEDMTANFAAGQVTQVVAHQGDPADHSGSVEVTPELKRSNSRESEDSAPRSPRSNNGRGSTSAGIGSSLRSIGDALVLRSTSKESIGGVKRRLTTMEIQRQSMLTFQNKMLQATILGMILGTTSVVITIIMCDSRLLGPVIPLMFICIGSGFFLQFFVINLYFPENLLHERFMRLLPGWLQDRIDGVVVDDHGSSSPQ